MGRAKRKKLEEDQFDSLVESLKIHGVPIDFAKEVVRTAIDKGWPQARVLLHAGGWEPVTLFVMGEKKVSLRRILWTKGK